MKKLLAVIGTVIAACGCRSPDAPPPLPTSTAGKVRAVPSPPPAPPTYIEVSWPPSPSPGVKTYFVGFGQNPNALTNELVTRFTNCTIQLKPGTWYVAVRCSDGLSYSERTAVVPVTVEAK